MAKWSKGLVHVYTGNGKGKTTAAFGLAVRAAGAGMKICIHQFVKDGQYNEVKILNKIKGISIKQCGRRCFIKERPEVEDILCAANGLKEASKDIFSGKYDLVILDEINIALKFGLVKARDIVSLIDRKPRKLELVLTGRYCPGSVLKRADLVTEMKEVRHPYKKGIQGRRGIEF